MAKRNNAEPTPQAALCFADNYGQTGNLKVGWKYIKCAGYDEVEEVDELTGQLEKKRLYHHFTDKPCDCPPGPMAAALRTTAFEVAYVGGRGCGKTETALAWLISGNRILNPEHPVDISYVNSKYYRFLVLRETAADLDDFFSRAKEFFGWMGAQFTENPMRVRFPSGAEGYFAHLQDEQSYKKHQGKEFTRMVIEEAGQIGSEKLYLKTIMSCRSTKDQRLRPQVFLTANPGGPGNKWIKARFIDTILKSGDRIKPRQIYRCPKTKMTRTYIHATVYDNPYLLRDDSFYVQQLEMLPPIERERWLYGNFGAVEGQYFENFRRERKYGEPEEALHVIKANSVRLEPWWPRAIGLDWGYSHECAAVGGCWSPDGQLHVYREMVVRRMGTVEVGSELAKRWFDDIQFMTEPHLNVYLSHDAFRRDDDGPSKAEQIKRGIEMILGRDAVFVLAPTQDEETLPQEESWASMRRRQQEMAGKVRITLVKAAKNDENVWNLIREYLRFTRVSDSGIVYDESRARKILLEEGVLAHKQYSDACHSYLKEVLPKLLVWDSCPRIIEGLEQAIEDPNNTEKVLKQDGDDPIDALAHLANHFRHSAVRAPKHIFVGEHLRQLKAAGADTQSLVMAARFKEHQYDTMNAGTKGFNIPRRSGPTARRNYRVN